MKAIIGGTGIDKSEYFKLQAKTVSTPFGDVEYMEKDGIILRSQLMKMKMVEISFHLRR